MTIKEMSKHINLMMGEDYEDDLLSAYITQAQKECFEWEYQLVEKPDPEEFDLSKYDCTVVEAVIIGLSIRGAEGETQHSENGILRGFKYSAMKDYIRANIIPYARTI